MYGLCLVLGIALSVLIGEKLCRIKQLDLHAYWRAVFFGLVAGVLGARLYHVIDRMNYFITYPWEIFEVWRGGLGIWGGIIGGAFGVFVSIGGGRKALIYFDILAIVAPLAQAVGRWGNFFNLELFGYPTTLPWGIYVPRDFRPTSFMYYERFHPLFIYESILDFLLFIFLYKFSTRRGVFKTKVWGLPGVPTALYLVGYSSIRIPLEFMRPERWEFLGVPVAVVLSTMLSIASIVYLYKSIKVFLQKRTSFD